MTIQEFIKTENGKRYEEALKGCDKRWGVQYWESEEELRESLRENGFDEEDIEENVRLVLGECYKQYESDKDFVEVIN